LKDIVALIVEVKWMEVLEVQFGTVFDVFQLVEGLYNTAGSLLVAFVSGRTTPTVVGG
jgi:hypothetical protein